jgi:hypothetical protein
MTMIMSLLLKNATTKQTENKETLINSVSSENQRQLSSMIFHLLKVRTAKILTRSVIKKTKADSKGTKMKKTRT